MESFLAELAARGFAPPNFALNGDMHRFDRNGRKNAWMIGWIHHRSKDGGQIIVADYGDFKTQEYHEYRPEKISNEDSAAIKAKLKILAQKYAEVKKAKQAEAAAAAEAKFATCERTGTTEYMRRKLIPELFGAGIWQGALQVPMRQVGETGLCGLQYIPNEPGTKKLFSTGSRGEGASHVIGPPIADEVFLVEGFATGTSVHQATGGTVVVAFSSGNLGPVLRALMAQFPSLRVTICADDDRFSTKPDGTAYNAGREAAEKAAALFGANVVHPRFASDAGKPTDFNDLHVREGLDEVRRQLAPDNAESKLKYIPLGYDEGTHFFYVAESRDIVKITTFSKPQLFNIASQEYWHEKYQAKNGCDWDSAINELIRASRAVGPFDAIRIRGTGVWQDAGRTVVNTGFSLVIDGREVPMAGLRSRFIYIQTKKRMPAIHESPLTVAECAPLLRACSALRWRQEQHGVFLAGWLAIARIAGALPVHPHVWLTGGAGTGKSTVMNRIILAALGSAKGRIFVQGGSTEAGIRQEIKCSTLPLLFDEFEPLSERTISLIDAVNELLRNAWSYTDGSILKGSVGGNSVAYLPQFCALVSSIRPRLTNDADRSRFTLLELEPHGNNPAQWGEIKKAIAELGGEEFGERLFARMIRMVPTVLASLDVISDVLAGEVSQRFGQQTGTILAGWWALNSDDVITAETARGMIKELDLVEDKCEAAETDHEQLLSHLLTCKIRAGTADKSIGEIILGDLDALYEDLRRYGVIVKKGEGIYVANKHAELARILKDTRWSANWNTSLRRIPGSLPVQGQRFGSDRQRATFIPLSAILA